MYSESEYNYGSSPQKIGQQMGTCFHCKKAGHWYKNCPVTQTTIITTNSQFPLPLLCGCGFGHCLIRTSRTPKNPNRMFYCCPGASGKFCDYFRWCDQVTVDEFENPHQYRFPVCNYEAGICHVEQVKGGPNDGRNRFVGSIQKGDGACSFSQWLDPQRDIVNHSQAESINLNTPPPTLENQPNSDFSEDENVSFKPFHKRDFESLEIDNFQHSPSPDAISPSKRSNVLLSEDLENYENATISPPRVNDSSVCIFDATAGSANGPIRDLIVSHDDVRSRSPQTEFRMQISFAEGVYPNSESEPLDKIFPSTPKKNVRLSSNDFRHTNDGSEQTNVMKISISEAFRQAALAIQNDLIKLLVSMDILDHKGMVRESESVFSVMDHLGIEKTHFHACVLNFIECASSQVAIEKSFSDDVSSSQKLVDEQERLEILTCTHEKLMSELTSAKERLGSLKRQVSDCEAETNDLESRVAGISEKIAMSKNILEAVSKEGSKICEQREIERSSVKEALEKAKLKLRQLITM